MARIAAGLEITKMTAPWASGGNAVITDPADVTDGAIDFLIGLPSDFEVNRFLQLGLFNWLHNGDTAVLIDIARHGLLEWHDEQPYEHPARVLGSDGDLYASVQDSTGEDPTTDTSGTYWVSAGVLLASTSDVLAGSATDRAITPGGLISLFAAAVNARWQAATDQFGLTRYATASETDTGTASDRAVTPAGLRRSTLVSTSALNTALADLEIATDQIEDDAVTGTRSCPGRSLNVTTGTDQSRRRNSRLV